jgi:hypothetical protein
MVSETSKESQGETSATGTWTASKNNHLTRISNIWASSCALQCGSPTSPSRPSLGLGAACAPQSQPPILGTTASVNRAVRLRALNLAIIDRKPICCALYACLFGCIIESLFRTGHFGPPISRNSTFSESLDRLAFRHARPHRGGFRAPSWQKQTRILCDC